MKLFVTEIDNNILKDYKPKQLAGAFDDNCIE